MTRSHVGRMIRALIRGRRPHMELLFLVVVLPVIGLILAVGLMRGVSSAALASSKTLLGLLLGAVIAVGVALV